MVHQASSETPQGSKKRKIECPGKTGILQDQVWDDFFSCWENVIPSDATPSTAKELKSDNQQVLRNAKRKKLSAAVEVELEEKNEVLGEVLGDSPQKGKIKAAEYFSRNF